MEMDDGLPAVVTFSSYAFELSRPRIWAELRSGAAIHIIHGKSNQHRAWLVRQRPEGRAVTPIGSKVLFTDLARIVDEARDGTVFEVTRRGKVMGYLTWSPPAALAATGLPVSPYIGQGRLNGKWDGSWVRFQFPSPSAAEAVPV